MPWYLLLIWAQGLRQTPLLTSGAVTGRIVTVGNISAEEGGSIILQCHLSSTTAKVTQVDWQQQDQLMAVHNAARGWHVCPAFSKRLAAGPNLSLTLQSLTRNDTGQYSCIYHTFPDGIYEGRLFLEVLQNSGAEHSAGLWVLLLGVILLGIMCTTVTVVVRLARKRKLLRVRSAEGELGRAPSEQEQRGPSLLSVPGSYVQAEAAAAGLCGEQRGGDDADHEPHDYFNVLSYRSLGDFSFPAETG